MFKHTLMLLPIAILALASCKKKGCSESPVTKEKLQGKWVHDYPKREADFTQPDEYNFMRFEGDSFFLMVSHQSDMMFMNGCNQVHWSEYVKGVYKIASSKLLLHGVYTEPDFSIKTSGCYNIGAYENTFNASFCNAEMQLREVAPKVSYPNYDYAKMVKE